MAVNCPRCKNTILEKKSTTTGVELDTCKRCGLVFLDRGEIFLHLSPKQIPTFDKAIESAVRNKEKSRYISPKIEKEMYNINALPAESNQFLWMMNETF